MSFFVDGNYYKNINTNEIWLCTGHMGPLVWLRCIDDEFGYESSFLEKDIVDLFVEY